MERGVESGNDGEGAAAPFDGFDSGFESVLRFLRGLALPCFPPVGVGTFDVLYASEREVVVWYSPAREEHHEGEVSIPCPRIASAWAALVAGEPLDEAALERHGEGAAGGRWLLALLAQLPGIRMLPDPFSLVWSPTVADEPARREQPQSPEMSPAQKPRKRRTKAKAASGAATTDGGS